MTKASHEYTKKDKICKYLEKFGYYGWKLEIASEENINNVIVVPAISEYKNVITLLNSLSINYSDYFHSTAIIFVVNNSVNSNSRIKKNNLKTCELLRQIISNQRNNSDFDNPHANWSRLRIGLINACSDGKEFPTKLSGAGFARKIGMDTSLGVFDYSNRRKNLLICLDADCIVDKNYMNEIISNFNEKKLHAGIVNFKHRFNIKKTEPAIICYEIYLRYYVLGLKYANSPFAFYSVGSTIVCDDETYIKVGGMNLNKAGEDFYFLEKITKIAPIGRINSTTVYPSSRSSWRVPFGTGPRIKRFLEKERNEYLLYRPKCFYILKKWLDIFSKNYFTGEEFLKHAERINKYLYSFLKKNDFAEHWNKILSNLPVRQADSNSQTQLDNQKINWFDGFRTLKLIHYLRDNGYQSINMFDALDEILSKYNLKIMRDKRKAIPGISIQKEYLDYLRELTK